MPNELCKQEMNTDRSILRIWEVCFYYSLINTIVENGGGLLSMQRDLINTIAQWLEWDRSHMFNNKDQLEDQYQLAGVLERMEPRIAVNCVV